MSYEVVVSDEAERQLLETSRWYADRAQSDAVAVAWYDGLIATLASLSESPDRCPLARESDRFSFELREILYGSGRRKTHRILFRIHGVRVEILSIRHFAQRDITPTDL